MGNRVNPGEPFRFDVRLWRNRSGQISGEGGRGYTLVGKFDDEHFVIRGIGVICEILPRFRGFFQGTIFDKTEFFHFLYFDQVRQNVIPSIIQIGVDFVSGKVPGLPGEFDSDVAADGANPHGFTFETQGCVPET